MKRRGVGGGWGKQVGYYDVKEGEGIVWDQRRKRSHGEGEGKGMEEVIVGPFVTGWRV
jgi:hypothetical protein